MQFSTSGSALGLSMIINHKDIKITKGKMTIKTINYNGAKIDIHYCLECETLFGFSADSYPDFMVLARNTKRI